MSGNEERDCGAWNDENCSCQGDDMGTVDNMGEQEKRKYYLTEACEYIKIDRAKNPLDDSLFIVTIGDKEHVPTADDIRHTFEMFENALADTKKVRIVVSHNMLEVEQLKANGIIKAADSVMRRIYQRKP